MHRKSSRCQKVAKKRNTRIGTMTKRSTLIIRFKGWNVRKYQNACTFVYPYMQASSIVFQCRGAKRGA